MLAQYLAYASQLAQPLAKLWLAVCSRPGELQVLLLLQEWMPA